MDFFSHAVLPYLLGSFLGLKKKHLAALVLGGIAPDLDTLVVWINYIYPTSLLIVHRGFTHTFFFGFFVAAFILFLATRDRVLARAQRLIRFDLDFSAPVPCLCLCRYNQPSLSGLSDHEGRSPLLPIGCCQIFG